MYYRQHSSFVFLPCLCQRRCPVRVQLALHWRLLPLSSLVHCAILTAGASWPRFDSLPLPTRRHFAASSRVLCHNKGWGVSYRDTHNVPAIEGAISDCLEFALSTAFQPTNHFSMHSHPTSGSYMNDFLNFSIIRRSAPKSWESILSLGADKI